jgi:hypothetical protein
MLSGCNKNAPSASDATTPWLGVYAAAPGNSLTQIQISKAGDHTLKIVLKINQFSYVYTATTLQSVAITGANTGTISENEKIIESTDLGIYGFRGTILLNGTHINLNAVATNVDASTSPEFNPMNFTFSGDKVQ